MDNIQQFKKNVDHARSAEYHLSCSCDFVVRYNNIQRANANIAGNGDHTNSAVAPTKFYRSVKDYLEVTMVNQNQGVTLSDVHDLHIEGLERNESPNRNSVGYKHCSHVYEMTPRNCNISVSIVSLGNKGCHFIWHVDPERSQLVLLHDWQPVSILRRSPKPCFLAWLCLQQNPHCCGHTW